MFLWFLQVEWSLLLSLKKFWKRRSSATYAPPDPSATTLIDLSEQWPSPSSLEEIVETLSLSLPATKTLPKRVRVRLREPQRIHHYSVFTTTPYPPLLRIQHHSGMFLWYKDQLDRSLDHSLESLDLKLRVNVVCNVVTQPLSKRFFSATGSFKCSETARFFEVLRHHCKFLLILKQNTGVWI